MSRTQIAAVTLTLCLGHAAVHAQSPADRRVPSPAGQPATSRCGPRGGQPSCPRGATVAIDLAVVTAARSGSGDLRFLIEPATAEVYIDGFYAGTADALSELSSRSRVPVGTHRVEVRAPGYWSPILELRVERGRTTVWRGRLTPVADGQ